MENFSGHDNLISSQRNATESQYHSNPRNNGTRDTNFLQKWLSQVNDQSSDVRFTEPDDKGVSACQLPGFLPSNHGNSNHAALQRPSLAKCLNLIDSVPLKSKSGSSHSGSHRKKSKGPKAISSLAADSGNQVVLTKDLDEPEKGGAKEQGSKTDCESESLKINEKDKMEEDMSSCVSSFKDLANSLVNGCWEPTEQQKQGESHEAQTGINPKSGEISDQLVTSCNNENSVTDASSDTSDGNHRILHRHINSKSIAKMSMKEFNIHFKLNKIKHIIDQ